MVIGYITLFQYVKELSLLNTYLFVIILSIMLKSSGEEKYLFSQLSEPSLDQGKALTYLGQARLRNSSISLTKEHILTFFFLHHRSD